MYSLQFCPASGFLRNGMAVTLFDRFALFERPVLDVANFAAGVNDSHSVPVRMLQCIYSFTEGTGHPVSLGFQFITNLEHPAFDISLHHR